MNTIVERANRPVEITVYRITGRQGIIDIPHRFCEECDLTIQLVRSVIDELDIGGVTLRIRPWLLWFWKPLPRGGWHAPIVTINGCIISQGVVPERERILEAIRAGRGVPQSGRGAADQPAGAR